MSDLRKLRGKQRAKVIAKAIRLTMESLESHLDYTFTHSLSEDKVSEEGDYEFHKMCVQNYAEVARLISLLY